MNEFKIYIFTEKKITLDHTFYTIVSFDSLPCFQLNRSTALL